MTRSRRRLLSALGSVATVALAGCVGNSGNGAQPTATDTATATRTATQTSTDTPTATQTETQTATATAEPPSFELVSTNFPSRVEIGKTTSYSFKVRNTGGAGTFQTEVRTKEVGDTQWSDPSTWSREIENGETARFESLSFSVDHLTGLQIHLGAFDVTGRIDFVARTLPLGKGYYHPNGVISTAMDVEFADSYEYTNGDFTRVAEPSEGHKWALVTFLSVNESGQQAELPYRRDISLIFGNSQYESKYYWREADAYNGGAVQPGIERRGEILYEVPESVSLGDAQVVLSDQTEDFEDISVFWSEGFED